MGQAVGIFLLAVNILFSTVFSLCLILTVTYAGVFLRLWTVFLFGGLFLLAYSFRTLIKGIYPGIASYTVPEEKFEKLKMEAAKTIASGSSLYFPLYACLSLFVLFIVPCGCKVYEDCPNLHSSSSIFCQNFSVLRRTSLLNRWSLAGLSILFFLLHCLAQYCFMRFIDLKLVNERVTPATPDPRLTRPVLELKEKRKAFGQRQDSPFT